MYQFFWVGFSSLFFLAILPTFRLNLSSILKAGAICSQRNVGNNARTKRGIKTPQKLVRNTGIFDENFEKEKFLYLCGERENFISLEYLDKPYLIR